MVTFLVLLALVVLLLTWFPSSREELVIARFNEDIGWLRDYERQYKITVYNKGPVPIPGSIQLPNVGNEGHTFLWHIVNNYDTLAPRTVFLMGSTMEDAFDKKGRTMKLFGLLKNHNNSEFGACCYDVPSLLAIEGEYRLDEYEKTTKSNTDIIKYNKLAPSPERPFKKWFETNFGQRDAKKHCSRPVFAVTRDDIKRHPKSYYKHLMDKYLSNDAHVEVGHYFERAWYSVFFHSLDED